MKWFRFIVILAVFGMVGCATARPTSTNTSNHEQEHTNLQSHNERVVDSTLIDKLREAGCDEGHTVKMFGIEFDFVN